MSTSTNTVADAHDAFRRQDYETVLEVVAAIERAGTTTLATLDLARNAHWKMGQLHRSLGLANRMRRLPAAETVDPTARELLGMVIETDPTWAPSLAAASPPEPIPDRILHILKESLPYSESGFTLRSRMTLAAQGLAGFDPQVVTTLGFPRDVPVAAAPTIQTVDGVLHHRLLDDTLRPEDLPFDIATQRTTEMMAAIARDVAPSMVQSGTGYRGFDMALPGIAIADLHDIPFVYEVRGFQEGTWTSNRDRSEHGEYYHRRHRQEDRCMQRADAVITIADAMAEEIAQRGVDENRLAVVPNAVDVERFTPRSKPGRLVERYGLSDRFVLGYVSNLGAREGIDQLIRATDILRDERPDVVCFIAGDGPERSKLATLVDELDLSDHVILAGHVPNEQIEDHYALIDLFVVPRVDDRASRLVTPLKPLEAMSMRLPVVVSSLPALEELVEPGVRGLSFAPSDPAEMADVLRGLIEDRASRERFANAGHDWVKQERTVQANAIRYERILRPLM